MPAQATAAARKSGGRTRTPQPAALPPVTVARLEEVGKLIERVAAASRTVFITRGHEYKEAHRQASSRPLTANEAAQIAASLGSEHPIATSEEAQESTLRAYDEPSSNEVLLAAGLATAPEFIQAAKKVVALVEMPADQFKDARESDTLHAAIDQRALALDDLEAREARARASRAFQHYADALGFSVGEAARLPVEAVWQALVSAAKSLQAEVRSSSLTDSAASTAGPEPTSSTR